MKKIYCFSVFLSLSLFYMAQASEEIREATNYGAGTYSIGFNELHERGYTGHGAKIVIIEPHVMCFSSSYFLAILNKMTFIDASRNAQCSPSFSNSSKLRYPPGLEDALGLNYWSPSFHSQKVASILTGASGANDTFLKGIVPDAGLVFVAFSQLESGDEYPMQYSGTALRKFGELRKFKGKKSKDELHDFLSNNKIDREKVIDDSIFDALEIAFQSGARIIEGSFNLQSPCDPLKQYYLSEGYLDFLAKGLEENDQIMIFSAGNTGENIAQSIKTAEENFKISPVRPDCFHWQPGFKAFALAVAASRQNYFKQYATHPILKERFLIVTSLALDNAEGTQIRFSNGSSYKLCLSEESCFPGEDKDLQEITVSAFGHDIWVAKDRDLIVQESGTSLAVPMVSGLLSLIDEHYKEHGRKLSGPELVKILKAACILPEGKRDFYGKGIIDPLGFLKDQN